jgi:hypothetical protein
MSYSDDDKEQCSTFKELLEKANQLSDPDQFRLVERIFDRLPQSEQIRIARTCRDKFTAVATLDEPLYVHVVPLLEKFAAVEPQ